MYLLGAFIGLYLANDNDKDNVFDAITHLLLCIVKKLKGRELYPEYTNE